MRLVTPGKLNRLLNEEKEREESLFDFDKLWRNIKKKLKAFNKSLPDRFAKLKEVLGNGLSRLWEALLVLWDKTKVLWGKTKIFAAKEWKILKKKWRKLLSKIRKAIAERSGSNETLLKAKPAQAKRVVNTAPAGGKSVKTPPARRTESMKAAPARRTESVKTAYTDKSRRASYEVYSRSVSNGNRPKSVSSAKKPASRAQQKRVFDGNFVEKHIRSIVSMTGLVLALIVLLLWGTCSDGGRRTFANLGMGSASGYILLGDDCMAEQNYTRAVEHYYTALSKKITYNAAIKLASAYSYAGDINHEVSALLLCVDHFPKNIQPYKQLLLLYPDSMSRPEAVNKAVTQGYGYFGDAISAN